MQMHQQGDAGVVAQGPHQRIGKPPEVDRVARDQNHRARPLRRRGAGVIVAARVERGEEFALKVDLRVGRHAEGAGLRKVPGGIIQAARVRGNTTKALLGERPRRSESFADEEPLVRLSEIALGQQHIGARERGDEIIRAAAIGGKVVGTQTIEQTPRDLTGSGSARGECPRRGANPRRGEPLPKAFERQGKIEARRLVIRMAVDVRAQQIFGVGIVACLKVHARQLQGVGHGGSRGAPPRCQSGQYAAQHQRK